MLPKVMQPRSGLGELLVKRLLAAIARPVAAIERERGVVEDEPPRAATRRNMTSAIKGEPPPRWNAPRTEY
jgi:hypothetical protein